MSKNKKTTPKKHAALPEDQDDALTHSLVSLAVEITGLKDSVSMQDALKPRQGELQKLIRKCLQQRKDDVLLEALETTLDEDSDAYLLLKEAIEDASENILFRRDDGRELEVNAFVIPLFAHTDGGLRIDQCFQDEEAFDLLRKSIQDAKLESDDASVVLVSHAYHLDEIEEIGFSQLHEMIREAYETMTRKKITATPAITRSMSGWPENHFAPTDRAVELRFLLGFTLKRLDDPFYRVPEKEAAADRYFEARAARFRRWTTLVAPLIKRCLVTDGRDIDVDFLYQDLFHGGKERGIAEYDMLQMMSELHHGLQVNGIAAEHTRAIIGPTDAGGGMALRVNLYASADDALVASSDKPLGIVFDLQAEADDAFDALSTIGVTSLSIAKRFDEDGRPVDARPYRR
ncbi:MAG TPA: DUF2863 family protein [Noviherbaspirillum sp.]